MWHAATLLFIFITENIYNILFIILFKCHSFTLAKLSLKFAICSFWITTTWSSRTAPWRRLASTAPLSTNLRFGTFPFCFSTTTESLFLPLFCSTVSQHKNFFNTNCISMCKMASVAQRSGFVFSSQKRVGKITICTNVYMWMYIVHLLTKHTNYVLWNI